MCIYRRRRVAGGSGGPVPGGLRQHPQLGRQQHPGAPRDGTERGPGEHGTSAPCGSDPTAVAPTPILAVEGGAVA